MKATIQLTYTGINIPTCPLSHSPADPRIWALQLESCCARNVAPGSVNLFICSTSYWCILAIRNCGQWWTEQC